LVLAALLLTCQAVHAALLAHDPFMIGANAAAGEYLAGDDSTGVNVLAGQDPTIGPTAFYSGAWIQSGGDSQAVKLEAGLAYPGLGTAGGMVRETNQFSCCSFGRSARPIAGGLGGGAARTVYESFLIDFGTQGTDDPSMFGFRGHELWNGGVGDSFKAVSLFVNHFAGISDLSLEVATPGGSTVVPLNGALDLNDLAGVHLVVMKYQFNPVAPDVVSVFLDPAIGGGEPGLAHAQVSVPTSDLFITHHGAISQFTFSGAGHTLAAIDEIRWADTFAEAIPEPSTPLLLLAAAAAGSLSRRRSRGAVRGG
jgi:hypothetical protein